jgi:hypothetical protein
MSQLPSNKCMAIKSQIISNFRDQDKIAFLLKSLGYPSKIQLIFRASQHNFEAAAFHEHCDNIEDTLVLAKTEFGKTIAGFTHYKWNEV